MFLTAESPQSVRNVKNAKIQNMETSSDLPSYENIWISIPIRLLILIGILNRFYDFTATVECWSIVFIYITSSEAIYIFFLLYINCDLRLFFFRKGNEKTFNDLNIPIWFAKFSSKSNLLLIKYLYTSNNP